jgi:hypothetical protein
MKLQSGAFLYTRIIFADVRSGDRFTLFPNPAKDEIYISLSVMDQVSLFSINGKKMKVSLKKINNNQVRIDTSSLQAGMYVVRAGDYQKQFLVQ